MIRIRFPRALIVSAVIASLLVLPAAAQAASQREDHRDGGGAGISLLGSLFEWVVSVWGAGNPDFDPTGRRPPELASSPEAAPSEGELSTPEVDPSDR